MSTYDIYKTTLAQADETGRYVNLGKSYRTVITTRDLSLGELTIPLPKIIESSRVGQGAFLLYLDANKVRQVLFLTTSGFLGFFRARKMDEFLSHLTRARKEVAAFVSPAEIEAAKQEAPADSCQRCGARESQYLGIPLNSFLCNGLKYKNDSWRLLPQTRDKNRVD